MAKLGDAFSDDERRSTVLAEAGMAPDEIDALAEGGVIAG